MIYKKGRVIQRKETIQETFQTISIIRTNLINPSNLLLDFSIKTILLLNGIPNSNGLTIILVRVLINSKEVSTNSQANIKSLKKIRNTQSEAQPNNRVNS